MSAKTVSPARPRARRRGYTLTEILVASTVAAMAATGMISLLVYGLYRNNSTAITLSHTEYVRNLTQELYQDIRSANTARIFADTSEDDILAGVNEGLTGNYLLLAYRAWEPVSKEDRMEWVIGYYIVTRYNAAEDKNEHFLYRFRDDSPSAAKLNDIDLDSFSGFGTSAHRLLASYVEMADGVPAIFENMSGGGVRVQARFSMPNPRDKKNTARFTLYNFTVTPRG